MPNSVLRGAVAERAEELFFYLFNVSLKSQRLLIFKLLMNIAFVVALVESMKIYTYSSWVGTFFCLFMVNVVHLCTELSDILFFLNSSDAHARLIKPLATAFDIIGSIIFKFTLLLWIINGGIPSRATLHLLPTWICMLSSTTCRCFIAQKRLPAELITRHRVASFFGAVVYLVYRFLQPLLIILKIDIYSKASWYTAFAPSFALAFLALGFSFLLYSFVPWVHYHSNRQLRNTAKYLTLLIAFCLLLAGTGSMVFLVSLCQILENHSYHHSHFATTAHLYRLVTPLFVIYIVFLGAVVVYYNLYKDYQHQLASRVLTRLDRPASLHTRYFAVPIADPSQDSVMSKWSLLKYEKVTHWLVYTSASVYVQATSDSVPSREEYVLKFGHDKTSKHNSGAHEESTDKNGGDIEMCTIASAGDEEAVEAHSPNHGEQPLTLLLESSPSNSAFPTLTSVERCVVCFSRAVSVIFQECGHAATCLSCAVAIARSSNQDPQCPLCRQAFTCMFDMPLGNRFTYQHSDLSPSQPTTNALIESSAKSLPIEASTADYEVIRSDWLYSFAKPGSLPGASNAGNEASLVAADMNNAQAIGNTVNALAAINTVSNHFSLIDILL